MSPHRVDLPKAVLLQEVSLRTSSAHQVRSLNLAVGEVLAADVLDVLSDKRYIISIKGSTITADSEAVLKPGDRVVVRVEQQLPRVVLNLVEVPLKTSLHQDDLLRWYRSNPAALRDMFSQAAEVLSHEKLGGLIRYVGRNDIKDVLELIKSLFFPPEDIEEGAFLRDYARNLGLLRENFLRKAAVDRRAPLTADRSLKGVLMKIAGDLTDAEREEKIPVREEGRLRELLDFLDRSVRTVEAHQMVNILCRERDDGFIFQIPFFFPGGVKAGDVFVRRNRNSEPGGDSFEVVLFLDMDALGKIVVEAGIRGERIRCRIRCENKELNEFLSGALDELSEAVRRAGCRIESVACIAETGLEGKKESFYRERLFPEDAVDLFA